MRTADAETVHGHDSEEYTEGAKETWHPPARKAIVLGDTGVGSKTKTGFDTTGYS